MHITFGLDLDGYRSPRPDNNAGKVTTGPNGLLTILETQLGLTAQRIDAPERIGEYLHCLRCCDNGSRFYSKSFAVDALGVSKTLLFWRDSWIEAGWNQQSEEGNHQILADLAAVESIARKELSPGFCDRLRRVLVSLEQRNGLVLNIVLVERCEELPPVWKKIVNLLVVEKEGVGQVTKVLAESGTDLARLQKSILDNTFCEMTGDGTVLLFRAHSEQVLAKALVQYLYTGEDGNCTTLISGNSGELFDMALVAQDHPLVGNTAHSHWRPHLQVLPLLLDLLWNPLDPFSLLEFLSHPVNPLPAYVCRRLAQEVAENPGMGGKSWNKALQDLQNKAVSLAEDDEKAGIVLLEKINRWLNHPRYDPEQGVEISLVGQLCDQTRQWFAAKANSNIPDVEQALYYAASAQAAGSAKILNGMVENGQQMITRLQLNRLLEQVTSTGSPRPDTVTECCAMHSCGLPAAMIESNDNLLWWDFTSPRLPAKYPWPAIVTKQLMDQGATLSSTKKLLQRVAKTWLQPLLQARQRVFFAAPVTRHSDSCVLHPLWEQLNPREQATIPVVDIDTLLDNGLDDLELFQCLEQLPVQPLPHPVRWWQVNGEYLLAGREKESYSSLHAFLFSPYQWVLRYKAKLREGSLNQVKDGAVQQGSLLHLLFEELFGRSALGIEWKSCSKEELTIWVKSRLPQILADCGANLLLPGRRAECENLITTGQRSAWALINHLRAAEIVEILMEKHHETGFFGGKLGGYIDMLVTNRSGNKAVIDLKLGGLKYRRSELTENQHLQLTIYAYLEQAQGGEWPDQAFFILQDGLLLAQDSSFFPDAATCIPEEGETALSLWQDFEKTWKWRREQLDKGMIEITVQGTEADEDSVPSEDGMHIEEFNDRFNDFSALTGWIEE